MRLFMADENKTEENKKSKNLALAFAASQMGIFVAVGLLGGLWLDKKFATTPIFGLVGLLSGFFAGFRLLITLVKSR
jgi:F0F1-type ATP synthase assembly protein I